ncbi:uncharacterized protein L201_000516 [Kwoniella dendrophila CBS 6074]|uniref:NAD-dependent epimerase/dehydratase domain-containing protein n=1 Tax=Kwoniella dendrophila CBS 6074 TaxID=1295534 RepID=A0AAX4JMA4_9TREE
MHVLLTGSAGVVGSSTLAYFLEQGHKVTALDIIPLPTIITDTFPKGYEANLNPYVIDLKDIRKLEAIIEESIEKIGKFDGCVHIGGIPNPLSHEPTFVYNTNVTTNYNILQTCVKYDIKRIVQATSVNGYGMSFCPPGHKYWDELPVTEQTTPYPEDPYATSKICCEIQASAITRYYPEFRVASLRYHMCKPNYKDSSNFSRMQSLWGWVSLESCARAALLGLTSQGWKGHETFILASNDIVWDGNLDQTERFTGEKVSSLDLLEYSWKGRYDESKLNRQWWANNPRRGFWDTTKAQKVLGWSHDDNCP